MAGRINRWMAERRACWAISLIAWSLRTLTPDGYKREIANWAHNFTADRLYSIREDTFDGR